jgi:uncharacterized protein
MFFGIGFIFIFVIGLFTAFIYAKSFQVSSSLMKLFLVFGALGPIIFVFTLAMGRTVTANPFTNAIYTVLMSLGGIIFYLFLGAVLLSIALLIALISKTKLPLWISWSIAGISLALGLFGLIQAHMIKVVEYSVTLPNAPASWNGKTGLLVADTQYNQINNNRAAIKQANKILEINPDFVLHAGDFYDGVALDTTFITSQWKRITDQIPVFYTPGNHEKYGDYEAFIKSVNLANITVLADAKTEYEGVQIAGISYRGKNEISDATTAISSFELDRAKPTIVISHPPTFQVPMVEDGVDLLVAGHTHNGQFWPINYLVKSIYGKYSHGIATDGVLTTITTSGVGTWGPPLRLFNTPELVLIRFN